MVIKRSGVSYLPYDRRTDVEEGTGGRLVVGVRLESIESNHHEPKLETYLPYYVGYKKIECRK